MEFIQSLFSLTWLATLIAFIIFWRKKVNAKKSAGENYADDENYKHISKIKKIIGIACIVSFVIASSIPSTPKTPEEEVRFAFSRELDDLKSAMKKDNNVFDYEFLEIDSIQFVSKDKAIVKFSDQWYFKNSKDGGKTFYKQLAQYQHDWHFKKYGNTWKLVDIDDDGEWLTRDELMEKYSK